MKILSIIILSLMMSSVHADVIDSKNCFDIKTEKGVFGSGETLIWPVRKIHIFCNGELVESVKVQKDNQEEELGKIYRELISKNYQISYCEGPNPVRCRWHKKQAD